MSEKQTYFDLINLAYPLETTDTVKHPRMSNQDRAKIFAPFAALKGYEEAIEAKQRILVSKVELSEEAKEELDQNMHILTEMLKNKEHPVVTIIYFETKKEQEVGEGIYVQFTGKVVKLLETARTIQIVDRKILFENIRQIIIL